jgi:3'-5' exoribonuclease
MIKDLKEGSLFIDNFLLSNLTKGTNKKGEFYLNYTFQDSSGSVEGKKWKIEEGDESIVVGSIVEVVAEVVKFNSDIQLKITKVKPYTGEVKLSDFQKSAPISKDYMLNYIQEKINSFKDLELKNLVQTMLDENPKFALHPAAAKIHHEYVSGLLHHTFSMLRIAYALKELYPQIKIDLLASGVLLHDIGKTIELSDGLLTSYTTDGSLLGHISIMNALIYETAKRLNISHEKTTLVQHMILSHHGKNEFGSPVLPATLEAEVLYMIDNIDSKINIFTKITSEMQYGNFSDRVAFLDGRKIYKPNENLTDKIDSSDNKNSIK